MAVCINKNSQEYQTLKKMSGISELLLDVMCSKYLEQFDRFPHLDELPGVNSKPFLESVLKLDNNNSTSISKILEYSGKESLEEANIMLNTIHSDLETEIIPIVDDAIVNINNRPNDTTMNIVEVYDPDQKVANRVWIIQALDKLSRLYGIKIHETSDSELSQWQDMIPAESLVNAFIYNGEIYINTDRASVDAPIHEMMHLLIGSLRFTNPAFYQQMISVVEQLPIYNQLLKLHPNRSRNDVNEEIFITEVSKHLTGMNSLLSQLSSKELYEIDYNIRRVLDSMLMGDVSTKSLSNDLLYASTLKQLTKMVNSNAMNSTFKGTFNEENSALHRKLNNRKADLIKQGILEEICE